MSVSDEIMLGNWINCKGAGMVIADHLYVERMVDTTDREGTLDTTGSCNVGGIPGT